MGRRGPLPKNRCAHGHNLNLIGAVRTVVTSEGYEERRCAECLNRRTREHLRKTEPSTEDLRILGLMSDEWKPAQQIERAASQRDRTLVNRLRGLQRLGLVESRPGHRALEWRRTP